MNATGATIDEQINTFAASVRRHLDDLPNDELDDILSGLTADLADQAADNDGVLDLGDPEAYAEELRAAAGLPPRQDTPTRRPARERLADWRANAAASIRRSAFGTWLLDLLISLRPVWWVLRGLALYTLVPLWFDGGTGLPTTFFKWMALIALVIVSVQWGRGRWAPTKWLRILRTVANIVAVILLPFALAFALTPRVEYVDSGDYTPSGLLLDGVQINNIFAYDAEGNLIDRVQLFTGKGTPLRLYGEQDLEYGTNDDGERATVPLKDYRGQELWNVYPIDEAPIDDTTALPEDPATEPRPPFQKAPALDQAKPTPTPTPTPGATSSPTPEPTPED